MALPVMPSTHAWFRGGPALSRAGRTALFASDADEVWVWDEETGTRITDLLDENATAITSPAIEGGWVSGVGIPVATVIASFSVGQFGKRYELISVETLKAAGTALAPTDTQVAALVDNPASATATSLSSTFAAKDSVPLNVRKGPYNAVGDGIVDDSTAIASCLADANSQGRGVYFPAGTYLGTFVIPVPAQLTGMDLFGDGVGRTILKGKDANPVVTVGDGGALDAQHITLRDMTIDGNGVSAVNVKMNNTRFLELSNVILQGATQYNLWAVGDVANYFGKFHRVRFRTAPINVYLDGGSAGIGGNSNYFDKCHFSGSSNVSYNGLSEAVAVAINGGDSNIFEDCEFIAAGTAIYLHNTAVGNKIIANQFDGPTTAVNCASAGVQSTRLIMNTGTVNVSDSGSGTMMLGAETASGFGALLYARDGMVLGGPKMPVGTTPLRVRTVAGLTTDSFRVEKSDGTTFFKVDNGGNIETSPTGVVTAHGHSTFDNAVNSSRSMTIKTGPTSATANRGLVVQAMNAGQSARLLDFLNSAGTPMAGVGPLGQIILPSFTTANRPSASASGAGAMINDSTLGLPIYSDGTTWKKFDGTAA